MQGEASSLWIQKDIFVSFVASLITENTVVGPTAEEIRQAFKVIDVGGAGTVDADQLNVYMTTMGEGLSQEEAEAFLGFSSRDSATGRVVDYEEYCLSVADILWKWLLIKYVYF